jgi:GntR family transcriptional regulator
MRFQINFNSGMPIYLQLVEQVKAAAASGSLQPGDMLPSIRPLAEELRVNRNTIAKAYTELENLGVIQTQAGRGCFLRPNQAILRKEVRRRMLVEDIDQLVTQAHHLNIPYDEFLVLVKERMAALEEKQKSNQAAEER